MKKKVKYLALIDACLCQSCIKRCTNAGNVGITICIVEYAYIQVNRCRFSRRLGNAEAIARTQFGVEDANAVLTAGGKPELVYFDSSNADCYQVDQDGNWSAKAANELP